LRTLILAIAISLFIVSSPAEAQTLKPENVTTYPSKDTNPNISRRKDSAFVSKNSIPHSCPKWESAIKAAGLPVKDFSYIAWRESRCRIKAINATWNEKGEMTYHLNKNKSWDSGLLQVNSGHRELVKRVCGGDLTLLLTLDCNLAVAKHLYDAHGLAPWTYVKPHDSSQSSTHQQVSSYRSLFPR
jgi:hypothetical protein